MLKLQSIKTGEFAWFVDTHLAVNIPNEEAIRQQQMMQAITLIEQRPDHERVIFFGDFNSVPTNASVRKIASNAGYKHLRAKLSPSLITRRTYNTFNGWKITKREDKWIDDVLTSPTVKPYAAAIMLTTRPASPSMQVITTASLRRYSSLLLPPHRPSDGTQVLDRLLSDPAPCRGQCHTRLSLDRTGYR